MSYNTKHAIMGMTSKRYEIMPWVGYIKNSKEAVFFQPVDNEICQLFEKVNFNYVPSKDIQLDGFKLHGAYKSTNITSAFTPDWFKLPGKAWREIRETRNHYAKTVKITTTATTEEIVAFIKEWNILRGKAQYGWQLHSGYDVNFFEQFYAGERDNLWTLFYWQDDRLIGYSVVSKESINGEYNYIIRKARTDLRNLNLYCDFKMFELIDAELKTAFNINWGSSKGSLLAYKKKFPVGKLEDTYFCKFVKQQDEQ